MNEKPQGAVAEFDAAVDDLKAAVRRDVIDPLVAWLDRPTRFLLLAFVLSIPALVALVIDLSF